MDEARFAELSKSAITHYCIDLGSNGFIKKRVGTNGAHGELVSISQDTDASSIANQEDSINCDSISIMMTTENKSIE
ncbi:hypothetical protein BGZ46_005804, partial [Entomortierella lignicola]